MTIDVNAYLGHFAFQQLRHNTPDALLRLMDSNEVGPRTNSELPLARVKPLPWVAKLDSK
jgi:hypothetical protein